MRRSCDHCGEPYEAKNSKSRYCGQQCRQRAHRAGLSHPKGVRPAVVEVADESTRAVVVAELERLGLTSTVEGRAALVLAARLDSPARETGAGLSSVARQLSALMNGLRGQVGVEEPDRIDELEAARVRRLASV